MFQPYDDFTIAVMMKLRISVSASGAG